MSCPVSSVIWQTKSLSSENELSFVKLKLIRVFVAGRVVYHLIIYHLRNIHLLRFSTQGSQ